MCCRYSSLQVYNAFSGFFFLKSGLNFRYMKVKLNLSKAVELSRLKKLEFEEFAKLMEKLQEPSEVKQIKRKQKSENVVENGK